MTEKKEKKMNDIKCLKVFLLFAGICLLLAPLAAYGHVPENDRSRHIHLSGRITTLDGQPVEGVVLLRQRPSEYLTNTGGVQFLRAGINFVTTDASGYWETLYTVLGAGDNFNINAIQVQKENMRWEKDGYTIRPIVIVDPAAAPRGLGPLRRID